MVRSVPEKFLVAFSLAGEQRALVRALAEEVERRLGDSTVFYDEWFEFYLAGGDADLKLQRIYHERCELAVICISGEYGSKPWTRAEHTAARARYMAAAGSDDGDRVLPVRVGEGEVDGIHLNHIVPDLRDRALADAAQLIIDRLSYVAPASTKPSASSHWPQRKPPFRWPMANHGEAQAAFCDLLMASSPLRMLPIQGTAETGKSSLAKQMERNVAELLPALRCGRFDFKSGVDERIEIEAFAGSLGFTGPGGNQLRGVLSQLLHAPIPTVIIFDTYEEASDHATWLERAFLPQLRRAEWLRVVILGQQVPSARDAVWESITAPTIPLTQPDAQAWFDYGRRMELDVEFDLDFVTKVHRLVAGRPAALRGIFDAGRP
ncbi:TIR domain-containing protein [Actinoplanes sp. NPDC026619]|uniref:TIR domain-containing protein n=1 Tax=Actinoplanes sp. NPDC026619 TaxID=3155798 RepID=UPI0033D7BAEC